FVPKRVLALSSLTTNPLVTAVPQPEGEPRLVWRTTYNSVETAGAASALIEQVLEPRLRATVVRGEAVRVAFLRPKSTAGAAAAEAIFRTLRVNGRPALENRGTFEEVTFEPEGDAAAGELEAAAAELVRFAPHVVIHMATNDVFDRV